MENLKAIIELVQSSLQLLLLLSLGFIILMGWIHQRGKESWQAKEAARRQSLGEPVLNLLPESQKGVVFWKDPALIRVGARTFISLIVLLGYVVIMLVYFSPAKDKLGDVLNG